VARECPQKRQTPEGRRAQQSLKPKLNGADRPGTRRACPRQIAAVQQKMPAVLAGILFK